MKGSLCVDLGSIGICSILQECLDAVNNVSLNSIVKGRSSFDSSIQLCSVSQKELNAFSTAGTERSIGIRIRRAVIMI